jgi:hypothetical protein
MPQLRIPFDSLILQYTYRCSRFVPPLSCSSRWDPYLFPGVISLRIISLDLYHRSSTVLSIQKLLRTKLHKITKVAKIHHLRRPWTRNFGGSVFYVQGNHYRLIPGDTGEWRRGQQEPEGCSR